MDSLIVGGTGGIGNAFVQHLLARNGEGRVHATYHRREPQIEHPGLVWHHLSALDESSIETLVDSLDALELCVNATGFLHSEQFNPEKATRQIDPDYFMQSMQINALPTLLLAKHLGPKLKHNQPSVFATVSARVGSIEENYLGGWYSYRASKAALNMVLKTLSIEWKRSMPRVCVASLHPGTTDTALSQPFQKSVPDGHLFSPEQSVGYMMSVIDKLTPQDTGRFWSFDGEQLPW